MEELNNRQIKFAELVALGNITDTEAYKQAGYSEKTAQKNAHLLRQNKAIVELIEEIREKTLDAAILTSRESMTMLSDMAKHSQQETDVNGMVKCIDTLNKMQGVYIEKVEQKVTGNTTTVNIVEDKRDEQ